MLVPGFDGAKRLLIVPIDGAKRDMPSIAGGGGAWLCKGDNPKSPPISSVFKIFDDDGGRCFMLM